MAGQHANLDASPKESMVQAEPIEVEAVAEENLAMQSVVEVFPISMSGVDDQSSSTC